MRAVPWNARSPRSARRCSRIRRSIRKLDEFITDVAAFLVDRYQQDIAGLITHTVQNWDADVTTRRIELAIGRDLQFIRINGTLVGALAGLLIYTISRLVP